MSNETKAGLYLLELTIGNVGMPGAPIFNFSGSVYSPTETITGEVDITQAVAPPFNDRKVQVSGRRINLLGGLGSVATLHGQYVVSVPPPAIGSYLAHLEIVMAFKDHTTWDGKAYITYAGGHINDVPVKQNKT